MKAKNTYIVLLVISLVFIFQTSWIYSQSTTITSFVCDTLRTPIPNAQIIVNQGEIIAQTRADGTCIIPIVSHKTYELFIYAVGYSSTTLHVQLPSSQSIEIVLHAVSQNIGTVTIVADTYINISKTESVSVELVEQEFLQRSQATSLVQALQSIPGVQSMDMGTGISKPMIRGLGFYRVVVAQNGIKQEGQHWSNHHGVHIDQNAVGHVEVIKGPASLQYGSDAIGGVINILPHHIPLKSGYNGDITLLGKSNTNWLGISYSSVWRKNDVYTNSTVTYNTFGDITIPVQDSFLLPRPVSSSNASHTVPLGNKVLNTAGSQLAGNASVGIIKPWGHSYVDVAYVTAKSGFFDWQGLQYDTLRRQHARSYNDIMLPRLQVHNVSIFHITKAFIKKNSFECAYGYQLHISQEFNYLQDITGNRTVDLQKFIQQGNLDVGLNLHTYSGNVLYSVNTKKNQHITYGVNSQYQYHTIDGYNHILPEYTRFTSGIFAIHTVNLSNKLKLKTGGRIDYAMYTIFESSNPDPQYGDSIFNKDLSKDFFGKAFSIGLISTPNNKTRYKINLGKSYRMPSVYELAAYGIHKHEGRFEKGSVTNSPEQAWQFDVAFERTFEQLNITISPFVTYFSNYLYLNPTPYLRTEGQVYEYIQTQAMYSGAETSIRYTVNAAIQLRVSGEYVYAVNLEKQSALPYTPPAVLQTEIVYSIKNARYFIDNSFRLEYVYAAKQKYTVPNELQTPGYSLLNAKMQSSLKISNYAIITMLQVKNVLNCTYYNHISFYRRLRIPDPGRSIEIMVQFPLK